MSREFWWDDPKVPLLTRRIEAAKHRSTCPTEGCKFRGDGTEMGMVCSECNIPMVGGPAVFGCPKCHRAGLWGGWPPYGIKGVSA